MLPKFYMWRSSQTYQGVPHCMLNHEASRSSKGAHQTNGFYILISRRNQRLVVLPSTRFCKKIGTIWKCCSWRSSFRHPKLLKLGKEYVASGRLTKNYCMNTRRDSRNCLQIVLVINSLNNFSSNSFMRICFLWIKTSSMLLVETTLVDKTPTNSKSLIKL